MAEMVLLYFEKQVLVLMFTSLLITPGYKK
jgi:hypothetical protein